MTPPPRTSAAARGPVSRRLRREPAVAGGITVRRHPAPEADRGRPTVITLSHQSPWPTTAGNEYRLRDMLDALREAGYRCVPVICPLDQDGTPRLLEALLEWGREFVLCHRSGEIVDLAVAGADLEPERLVRLTGSSQWADARALRLGPDLRQKEAPFTPPLLRAAFQHLLTELPVHAVIANYAYTAGLLELAPDALKIVDTHDVLSEQRLPPAQVGDPVVATLSRVDEAALLTGVDAVIAIQAREAQVLRSLVPGPVVTCGVSFTYRPLPPARTPPYRFVVLASDNVLNVAGLRGLLRGVWPSVLRRQPAARLVIAGRLSAHVPSWAPGVEVMGVVDDAADAYAGALASVNPASQGTGLKVKTLEALSFGRPVICWPAGADGLDVEAMSGLLVADDAEAMADHIVRLCDTTPSAVTPHASISRAVVYRDLLHLMKRPRAA